MKINRILIAFLMTLALVMAAPAAAFAVDYSNNDAQCSYDGEKITSNFESSDLATSISNLEPGDTLEYEVTYSNKSGQSTEWYMLNDAIETLEESKDVAENGGYTYVLKNIGPDGTETTYFDNSKVGGTNKPAGLEGLKQATNATREYFFIQELGPGQSGRTYLKVELDGESQVNDYMDTKGVLRLAYAVEKIQPGHGDKDKPAESHPRTGDPFDLVKAGMVMILALIIAVIAFLFWKKDRKDGDEA